MAIDATATPAKTALVPVKVQEVLAPYPKDQFTWLLPTAYMGQSELFRPVAVMVEVNAADKREVYDTPGGSGTVCLHSQTLERIANATGIDFDPAMKRHVHDFKNEPWICTIDVGGWYIDSLGQRRRISAGAKMDLRDGSPRSNLITRQGPKALEVARQFICEQNESRARNRAIRHACNLPSSFTRQELVKPMVALRFQLDERHPDVRRALIAQGTHAAGEVFGNTVGPALEAGGDERDTLDDVVQGEFVDTTGKVETEPEIPDAKPESVDEIPGIVAAIVSASSKGGDATPATEDYLLTLGTATRDLFGLTSGKDAGVVLRAIGQLVFGDAITSWRSFNQAQTKTLLAMTKEPDGQVQLRKLLARAQQTDESLAAVKFPSAKKAAA